MGDIMMNENNESIYNKDGFFNIKGWFKKINYDFWNDEKLIILTSPRNNGKSHSLWDLVNEMWIKTNYEWKIAVVRTNGEKMEKAKNSFKTAYINEYEVIGDNIFKFIYKEGYNENKSKKYNEQFLIKKHIGTFVNIDNEYNYRSASGNMFNGFHFVFYDEFNETLQSKPNLFQNFMMLISTIKRFNHPFTILLLGNKINANNDFFVKFNLNVSRRSLDEDWIQNVSDDIVYIDVGFNTYKHLNNKDNSLVNRIASFDKKTNRLFNEGGFLEGVYYNVLSPLNYENKKVLNYFQLGEIMFEYGTMELDQKNYYYINSEIDALNIPSQQNICALDTIAYARNGYKIEQNETKEIALIFYEKIKKRELYFSSFDLMLNIEQWLFKVVKYDD